MTAVPTGAHDAARCIEDACAICEIPAPTGHEASRGDWLASQLSDLGLDPVRDELGNVSARLGAGDSVLIVAAHMDTVFPDVADIDVGRDGAVLHAPGIGDNALGVAALLHLAREAMQRDWRDRDPLLLAATVGEEGLGNLRGARGLLDRVECREFVAIEGGFQDELIVGGVGSRRFEIVATAEGGHSWLDRGRPSAVHALVELLAGMLADTPASATNVGQIAGGTAVNVLAAKATATVEFRDVRDTRLAAAERRLRRAVEAAGRGDRAPAIAMEALGTRPAGRTARRHPLVRDALGARRLAGLEAPRFTDSSTDANAALGRGIPALTVGMATNHGPHTLDEHVDTTGLDRSLAALTMLVDLRTRRDRR